MTGGQNGLAIDWRVLQAVQTLSNMVSMDALNTSISPNTARDVILRAKDHLNQALELISETHPQEGTNEQK